MTDFDRLARYYDLEHEDWRQDLDVYAGFARAAGPERPILELACGTGRCVLHLAAAGFDVTGIDISPAMLALARAKAERAGFLGRLTLVEGDMRAFSLGRRYSLILIALNSLMHLESREAQGQAIACAARHLAPGGRFVVDLFNPDVALPTPDKEGQLFLHCLKTLPGGKHLLHFQSPTVDRGTQIVSMANYYDEIDSAGSVKRHMAPFTLRYLTRGELELLLESAGLDLEALYGSYDLDPFTGESEHLLAVARRP